MRTAIIAALLLGLLGGCAGKDRLNISCAELDKYKHKVPFSQLEREIHGLPPLVEGTPTDTSKDDDLTQRLDKALDSDAPGPQPLTALEARPPRRTPAVLMLSGGGQWGAFGAGFLDQMRLNNALPDARFVTGISTGALQSLFVSIGTPEAFQELLAAYAPAKESDIVDRGGVLRVLFQGSMAGLAPLQARIETALCPEAIVDDPGKPCPIDALKAMLRPSGRQTKYVLIGFTAAATGEFQYVDVVELAQLPRREARTCITGVALASAAMPVDFEQVQINGITYYDGGTRASVFEADVAKSAQRVMARRRLEEHPGRPNLPAREPLLPIYVVRNGPTTVVEDDSVDKSDNVLDAAMRAEAILVNQLEVTSIAMIRIAHPTGTLRLVTADGYDKVPCVKPGGGVMFGPDFMKCLTAFGRTKANAPAPWIDLSNLVPPGS